MGKRKKDEPKLRYLQMFQWVMDTPAWRDLSCNARCVYIEIARRYAGPGSNNGMIPMSLSELAKELHIGKATASRAVEELASHGFVVITRLGSFNLKIATQRATEFLLTEHKDDRPGHTLEMPSKAFTRWQPKKAGSISAPDRVPTRNRLGADVEQFPKVPMGFGSAVDTSPTLTGSATGPLIGYQSPVLSGEHHINDAAPIAEPEIITVEDAPVELSHDEGKVLAKLKDLKTSTHRLLQQRLSPMVKGEAIRTAAASLAERGFIRIGQKGRSDIYVLLGAGEKASIVEPVQPKPAKIDLNQFDMFGRA